MYDIISYQPPFVNELKITLFYSANKICQLAAHMLNVKMILLFNFRFIFVDLTLAAAQSLDNFSDNICKKMILW